MNDPRNPVDPYAAQSGQGGTGNSWSTGTDSTAEQAKREAQALGGTTKEQAADVKDSAVQQASEVKDHAADQARMVKDTAADSVQQVADTAKVEASQVVGEARDQIQGLLDTTMGEVRSRARDGQSALTTALSGLTDELGSISRGETTSGPVNQGLQQLAQRGESLSGWLQQAEPEDVVREVRRFAARRPVAFLAIAAGAGMVAGRLARGTREVVQDQQQPQLTRNPRTGYVQQGYQPTSPVRTGYASTSGGGTTRFEGDALAAPHAEASGYPTGGQQVGGYQASGYQPGADLRPEQRPTADERGDRPGQYGGVDQYQPIVTEGYVHTTRDPQSGVEGGQR